ncbi:Mitotic spindle checkpoint protein BUB3, WD repeat superfamily [Pseudoloma neurophilia]|uniref:Mitotic spindle checkpoint protein BUB3, WD repeat superfamily n=1 Tax=Pseudoloma neurophilia TaxID=146866 RepID=A0A0R0M683_9MICR|nr:Mitotic spindle checkpoint protein BUB3, WD repeat superfamily [Pseudoloma neurophilia]
MLLKNSVTDTITDIQILRTQILVSSVDKSIVVYNNTEIKSRIEHHLPITKLSVFNDEIIFSDIEGGINVGSNYIKTSCGGIQGLCSYQNAIMAGGWNKNLQIIQSGEIVHTMNLKNKIYAMDLNNHILLAGCDDCVYFMLDLRKSNHIVYKNVKNSVSSVSLGKCAAIGTTRGKIKLDFDLLSEKSENSYIFNAHITENVDSKIFYPVTSMIVGDTLISGGSDGRIIEMDYNQKRKLREIIHSDVPVSIIKECGNYIVAGFSDNYEKGELLGLEPQVRILEK